MTQGGDIWIYDLASGRSSRVTHDGLSQMAVWKPDGSEIAFSSAREGNLEAWIAPADASAAPRQLTRLGGQVHVDSWSPDGQLLSVHRHLPADISIYFVPLDGVTPPEPFAAGEAQPEGAQFSRDGRYVAYLSADTGQREIYVRRHPGPGSRYTVSVGGGREPVWAAGGDLFYRSLAGDQMIAVSTVTSPALQLGPPVPLFRGNYYVAPTGSPRPQFDVTPDGRRFLMLAPVPAGDSLAERPRIIVVQRWFNELAQLTPAR